MPDVKIISFLTWFDCANVLARSCKLFTPYPPIPRRPRFLNPTGFECPVLFKIAGSF